MLEEIEDIDSMEVDGLFFDWIHAQERIFIAKIASRLQMEESLGGKNLGIDGLGCGITAPSSFIAWPIIIKEITSWRGWRLVTEL